MVVPVVVVVGGNGGSGDATIQCKTAARPTSNGRFDQR